MISLEIFIVAAITGEVAFGGINTVILVVVESREHNAMAALDIPQMLHTFDDDRLSIRRNMTSFKGEYAGFWGDALVR
jgi:hypothetical protein